MLRTALCELLGIDVPILQGPVGPWSHPGLVAAVSNAGGLGTVGTALLPIDRVRDQIMRTRELTSRSFGINHTARPYDPDVVDLAIRSRPRVFSYAHGDPGELPRRAHDEGILFMTMINTVAQAERAAERGADIIIAQGGDAGGFGGRISTFLLLPQVVDAVSPVPVVASGGIADGRGLAAALLMGAQGINIGTRFLASEEGGVPPGYQQAIVDAASEDAVKVRFIDALVPPAAAGGYPTMPRTIRTPFVDRWLDDPAPLATEGPRVGREVVEAVLAGHGHEYMPFAGQSAGMIDEILPVPEIIGRLMAGAEQTLRGAAALVGGDLPPAGDGSV